MDYDLVVFYLDICFPNLQLYLTAVFSKFNKLLYCHFVVSTVDKGIENESYFIALSDKEFQNKKG